MRYDEKQLCKLFNNYKMQNFFANENNCKQKDIIHIKGTGQALLRVEVT